MARMENKEETQLRELDVDEDTIQRIHAYDWEMFKAERNYQNAIIDLCTFPEIVSEYSFYHTARCRGFSRQYRR